MGRVICYVGSPTEKDIIESFKVEIDDKIRWVNEMEQQKIKSETDIENIIELKKDIELDKIKQKNYIFIKNNKSYKKYDNV